jgi:hypothetical protein
MPAAKSKPKPKAKKKAAPRKSARVVQDYEALSDKVREQLADAVALGGSVLEPGTVAYEALNYFDAHRYHPWFRLIVETAAK